MSFLRSTGSALLLVTTITIIVVNIVVVVPVIVVVVVVVVIDSARNYRRSHILWGGLRLATVGACQGLPKGKNVVDIKRLVFF